MAKTKSSPKPIEDLTFEESLVELEQIVEALEGGASQNPLEDAIKLYERGQALVTHCGALLDAAQLKVQKLAGESLVDFEDEPE